MRNGNRLVCWLTYLLTCLSFAGSRPTFVWAQKNTSSGTQLNAALANLDPYIRASMATTKVPGLSVAVVYNDQIVFLKGYGVRKLGEPAKIDPDTIFQLASFSKPVGTTVVAEVVGNGEVSWDTPIKTLDPSFALSNPSITEQVTVRDLLSHRSTVPSDAGDTLEALGYDRPEIIHKMRLVPLSGVFRETYNYTNFGITEGVLAAVRPLGKQWEDVAEELLYQKLGMTRTSSRFSDYVDRPNRAALHYLDANGNFHNWFVREADAESPAGGVSSTARDLAQWLRLQLAGGSWNGQQIVDHAALEETHTPQVCQSAQQTATGWTCPQKTYYGLGWDIVFRPTGEKMISHSGAFLSGAATTVYMIPKLDIGILVLTNGAPVGLPEAVALNFLDIFQYGAPQQDYIPYLTPTFDDLRNSVLAGSDNYSTMPPPSNPSPGPDPSSLAGTYSNIYFGKLDIEYQQGKLILRLPPLGTYYELTHWDGDTWTYYIGNETSGAARRGVTFSGGTVCVNNLKVAYSPLFTKVR